MPVFLFECVYFRYVKYHMFTKPMEFRVLRNVSEIERWNKWYVCFFLCALQPLPQASPEGGDHICVHVYIPGTQITSIFDGQPQQDKAELPIKTRVIWVLGECKHIYLYTHKNIFYIYVCVIWRKKERNPSNGKNPQHLVTWTEKQEMIKPKIALLQCIFCSSRRPRRSPNAKLPGTPNNHVLMDVWWNNCFSCKVWNHPIETTILKWMFQVPGSWWFFTNPFGKLVKLNRIPPGIGMNIPQKYELWKKQHLANVYIYIICI